MRVALALAFVFAAGCALLTERGVIQPADVAAVCKDVATTCAAANLATANENVQRTCAALLLSCAGQGGSI